MLPKSLIEYKVYFGEDVELSWPYDYLLDGQGVSKRCGTAHFTAALRVARGRIAGLPVRYGTDSVVRLKVPRIPVAWLTRVLNHAQTALADGVVVRPIEQMYHFHWLETGWRVSVPRQDANSGNVRYQGGNAPTIVLDLHSHHEMAAYFSKTDDRDEQGCRFYAVIGKIYSKPEIRLRLGLYGDFIDLSPTILFEGLGPFMEA